MWRPCWGSATRSRRWPACRWTSSWARACSARSASWSCTRTPNSSPLSTSCSSCCFCHSACTAPGAWRWCKTRYMISETRNNFFLEKKLDDVMKECLELGKFQWEVETGSSQKFSWFRSERVQSYWLNLNKTRSFHFAQDVRLLIDGGFQP